MILKYEELYREHIQNPAHCSLLHSYLIPQLQRAFILVTKIQSKPPQHKTAKQPLVSFLNHGTFLFSKLQQRVFKIDYSRPLSLSKGVEGSCLKNPIFNNRHRTCRRVSIHRRRRKKKNCLSETSFFSFRLQYVNRPSKVL